MKAKIIVACAAAALLAIVIVGCSSGPAGVAFSNIGSIFPRVEFLYVVGDGDIAEFKVDQSTGAVTAVAGSPFAYSGCPDMAAPDPSGRFLFVPNSCNSEIAVLSIDPTTAALTPISGSPFAAVSGLERPVVDLTGRFLYMSNSFDSQVLGFKIGANGALSPISGSPFAAPGSAEGIAMHPTGQFLYVGTESGSIRAFSIDPTSGALTEISGSPFAAGTNAITLAISPAGDFLYVPDDAVFAFRVNPSTGVLTPVAGSPFSAAADLANPQDVAVSPDGNYLYVAETGDVDTPENGDVAAFKIDTSTGALTVVPGSPFTAGPNPKRLAADPSGRFLYVTIEDAGEPPALGPGPPGTGGLYVLSIFQQTGALNQIPGSPFTTNKGPEGIAITRH